MIVYVYGLRDPRDGRIRYVGQTKDLKARLNAHVTGSRDTPKHAWIQSLKKENINVELVILEQVEAGRTACEAEDRWIHVAQAEGHIFNVRPADTLMRCRIARAQRRKIEIDAITKARWTSGHRDPRRLMANESRRVISSYLGIEVPKSGLPWKDLRSVLMRLNAKHEQKCARLQELCRSNPRNLATSACRKSGSALAVEGPDCNGRGYHTPECNHVDEET